MKSGAAGSFAAHLEKLREAAGFTQEERLTNIRELQDKFAFGYALVPLAAAAVLKGDAEWAALIPGARDAVTEPMGVAVADDAVRDLQEQVERDARARLGPARWTRAYTEGKNASIDSLLRDIGSVSV